MPPALATDTDDVINNLPVAGEDSSTDTAQIGRVDRQAPKLSVQTSRISEQANPIFVKTDSVFAQSDEIFQQATQEGNKAIRLDPGNALQQGQRLYITSSW